jgi:hypothetical protein
MGGCDMVEGGQELQPQEKHVRVESGFPDGILTREPGAAAAGRAVLPNQGAALFRVLTQEEQESLRFYEVAVVEAVHGKRLTSLRERSFHYFGVTDSMLHVVEWGLAAPKVITIPLRHITDLVHACGCPSVVTVLLLPPSYGHTINSLAVRRACCCCLQVVDEEATHFRFNEESFENATRLFLVHRSFRDHDAGDSGPSQSSQPVTPRESHTPRAPHTPGDSAVPSVVSPQPTDSAPRAPKAREVEARHPSFTSPTVLRRGATSAVALQHQQQPAKPDPEAPPQPPTSLFSRLCGGKAAAVPKAQTSEQLVEAKSSRPTLESQCVPVCAGVRILAAGGLWRSALASEAASAADGAVGVLSACAALWSNAGATTR